MEHEMDHELFAKTMGLLADRYGPGVLSSLKEEITQAAERKERIVVVLVVLPDSFQITGRVDVREQPATPEDMFSQDVKRIKEDYSPSEEVPVVITCLEPVPFTGLKLLSLPWVK